MAVGDAQVLAAAKAALDAQHLAYMEADDQYITRLNVQHGVHKAVLRVSSRGALDVQGPDSRLKTQLQQIKMAPENGTAMPGQLPADIDQLLPTLQQRLPTCDPVIVGFLQEAIRCYKCDARLASAFMLGAASEKAMGLI